MIDVDGVLLCEMVVVECVNVGEDVDEMVWVGVVAVAADEAVASVRAGREEVGERV